MSWRTVGAYVVLASAFFAAPLFTGALQVLVLAALGGAVTVAAIVQRRFLLRFSQPAKQGRADQREEAGAPGEGNGRSEPRFEMLPAADGQSGPGCETRTE